MKRTIIWLAVQAMLATLSACGGGGTQGGDDLPASPVVERHRSI